jgi:DNA polymerase I-like protein with 3'-5' exonuclease and polymerase domains
LIINADAKGLEVVCAAYLSGDKVLTKELWDGVDIHGGNQKAFHLPEGKEGRLIAKILVFR